MLKLICDRCGGEWQNAKAYVYVGGASAESNAFPHRVTADVEMPEGWRTVEHRHLCRVCTRERDAFLRARTGETGKDSQ